MTGERDSQAFGLAIFCRPIRCALFCGPMPEQNSFVVRCTGKPFAIGAKGDCLHAFIQTSGSRCMGTLIHIPKQERFIVTGGGEDRSMNRIKIQDVYCSLMALEKGWVGDRSDVRQVPHVDVRFVSSYEEFCSILIERERVQTQIVLQCLADLLMGGRIPNFGSFIKACRSKPFIIR